MSPWCNALGRKGRNHCPRKWIAINQIRFCYFFTIPFHAFHPQFTFPTFPHSKRREQAKPKTVWKQLHDLIVDKTDYIHSIISTATKNEDITIEKIKCGSPRGLYDDGGLVWPEKKNVIWGTGDGTVPLASAIWPYTEGWAGLLNEDSNTEHAFLIKENIENIWLSGISRG